MISRMQIAKACVSRANRGWALQCPAVLLLALIAGCMGSQESTDSLSQAKPASDSAQKDAAPSAPGAIEEVRRSLSASATTSVAAKPDRMPVEIPISPRIGADGSKPPSALIAPPKSDVSLSSGTMVSDTPEIPRNPLRDRSGGATPSRPETPVQTAPGPEAVPVAASSGTASVVGPAIVEPAPKVQISPEIKLKSSGSPELVPKTAKHSGVPFDFIKENGPLFADWPQPKVALVMTGRQDGYLEPCGCAGLERMKGGMSRRYTMFKTLRASGWPLPTKGSAEQQPGGSAGWPVVGLDVGGIAKGFGKQAELKFQFALLGMRKMEYNAITLGTTDLQLPPEEVLALIAPVNNQKSPFVCGNVALFQFDETLLPRTQIIKTGFKTLGITSVLGKQYRTQINNGAIHYVDPEGLVKAAIPMLKQKFNADYLILLAHASKAESIALAEKFPDLNLVVTSGGEAEPPAQAQKLNGGKTLLIEVGEKGMYAVTVGLFDDPKKPFLYQRVTLDSRFAGSPDMIKLMAAYQDQLKDLGLSGLGIHTLPHPAKATSGRFVGTEACKSCHEESYRIWKKTPHSRAFASLKTAVPPRNFDPECISCHVVGWHPTKFFPYESGYLSEKQTPKLLNVGCEDCHGPGELHTNAETNGTAEEKKKYLKTVAISKEEAADSNSKKQNCYSCHDLDNSPDFDFKIYYPIIEHHEKE